MTWVNVALLAGLVSTALASGLARTGGNLNRTALAAMRGSCPSGYIEWYQGGCAYLSEVNSDSHTVPDAEAFCRLLGLHMPSIHSAEESVWVRDMEVQLGGWNCVILGLIPGVCQWYDGTPFDFDNMESGEVCNENVKGIGIYAGGDGRWRDFEGQINWFMCSPHSSYTGPTSMRTVPPLTGTWTPPTRPPTSADPSTLWPSTTMPFLTSGNPPSASPSTPSDSCGECSLGNVWLDIVFAVDSSQSMQQDGIDDVQATIRTTLRDLLMYRTEIRAGILVYSDAAEVIYQLDSINSDAEARIVKIPYLAQYGTNMESALVKSMSHFDDFPNKAKARKVIIMFASGNREGSYESPKAMATAFRSEGGVIITVDYSGLAMGPVPMLDDVASPGYELNRTGSIVDDIQKAFCDANCFCPSRSSGYTTGSPWGCQGRCTPSGGCFRAVDLAAAQDDAENDCQEKGGHLVSIHDDDHQQFVTGIFKTKTTFWIGLNARSNNWTDGTPFDYSHWAPEQPDYTGDCVYSLQYQGFKTGWYSQDCMKGIPYACSIRPCSAANKACTP